MPVGEIVFFEKGVPLDSLRLAYDASFSTLCVTFLTDNNSEKGFSVADFSSFKGGSFFFMPTLLKFS